MNKKKTVATNAQSKQEEKGMCDILAPIANFLALFFLFSSLHIHKARKCSRKRISITLEEGGKKNMKELLPMTCDNCRLILLSAVRAPPHPNSLSDYAPFCCSECTGNSFPLKYNNVPMVELINELCEAVWFWQLVGHRVGSLWWRSKVVGSDLNSFNLTCLKRHYLCFCSDWRTSGTARPQQVCEPWTKSKAFQDPLIKLHSCFFYIIAPIFKLYSNSKAIAAACPE